MAFTFCGASQHPRTNSIGGLSELQHAWSEAQADDALSRRTSVSASGPNALSAAASLHSASEHALSEHSLARLAAGDDDMVAVDNRQRRRSMCSETGTEAMWSDNASQWDFDDSKSMVSVAPGEQGHCLNRNRCCGSGCGQSTVALHATILYNFHKESQTAAVLHMQVRLGRRLGVVTKAVTGTLMTGGPWGQGRKVSRMFGSSCWSSCGWCCVIVSW